MIENRVTDFALDADRAVRDPELCAGAFAPDPWDEEPDRWAGTEPLPAEFFADRGPPAPSGAALVSAVAPMLLPVMMTRASSWVLTPALVALRAAFNQLNPDRDKASDGSIGDPAHAESSSDHNPDETGNVPIRDADSVNEVHAIDVDESGPWPADVVGPWSMMRGVRQLVTDHREGWENRLRYVIYERTIWSSSWGWAARAYTGANPHDKHAHFSGSYDTARERDTSPWNIGYGGTTMEVTSLSNAAVSQIQDAILNSGQFDFTRRRVMSNVTGRNDLLPTGESNVLHAKIDVLTDRLNGLSQTVDEVVTTLAGIADAGGNVDVAAVLDGVRTELSALREILTAELRDAVADAGEGGSAKVRADEPDAPPGA